MKKLIGFIAFICFPFIGIAQIDSTLLYLRFPNVPPFSIINVADSSKFTKENLAKKKATLIIIFSPDCDHCQYETKELTKHIALFKKAQIILASPKGYTEVKKFYEDYNISQHPNIIMGTDPSYFFGTFFKVRSFPSIFLYDKKGKFVKSFDGNTSVQQIAEFL